MLSKLLQYYKIQNIQLRIWYLMRLHLPPSKMLENIFPLSPANGADDFPSSGENQPKHQTPNLISQVCFFVAFV